MNHNIKILHYDFFQLSSLSIKYFKMYDEIDENQ